MRRRRRDLHPIVDELDERCLLSLSSGLTPAEITAAYGLSGITFTSSSGATVKGDGSGETIALIEMYHDPNLASDLHVFDQAYGLPDPTLNVIDQAGTQVDRGWGQEESLDVEWAHAIAPGAGILVVEAAPGNSDTQTFQDLMAAGAGGRRTEHDRRPEHSTGGGGLDELGLQRVPGRDPVRLDFSTPGITYIAASGDTPGVEYPAASPDVLAVGGTTLNQGASGGYGSETAWPDSGGGYSAFEPEPAYQQAVQAAGQRSIPDVAFDGDPKYSARSVYYTPRDAGGALAVRRVPQGSWSTVGGTSLGAPAWAGIVAIVDQGRVESDGTVEPERGDADPALALQPGLARARRPGAFHSIAATSASTPVRQEAGTRAAGDGFGGWGGWQWIHQSHRQFDLRRHGEHPDRPGNTWWSVADQ